MNLSDVKNSAPKHEARKRVGRGMGSGYGKTSGRGHKGQKSRAGYSRRLAYEGGQMPLFRRLPKRGFSNARFAREVRVVNVGDLNVFDDGAEVGLETLRKRGILKGQVEALKVLGRGTLEKALTVRAHAFSASARDKITEAGGKAEIL